MENWEALDMKRDGSLSLRAGLIEGGGHSCGGVVAAAYLCRRAVERWSARPSVEVSRPVLWMHRIAIGQCVIRSADLQSRRIHQVHYLSVS